MEGPLNGVKVVELAMWVAGPSAAAVLGDWGADVIKLEDPNGGDPIRAMGTRAMGLEADLMPPYEVDNRNKRSVSVDLRRPEGVAFAMRIIEGADVFITSLRVNTLARLGLDPATLAARNPRLIYATLNGYGYRGPDRDRPAFDYAAGWARTGLMATIAEPGHAPPGQRPGMIDHAAGLALAGAISAALLQRERTGRATEVRISLFQMGLWMNATDLTIGLIAGMAPTAENRYESLNPLWNRYPCRDGKWIYFVMLQSDKFWPDFCAAFERPQWKDDPRWIDFAARRENGRSLVSAIEEVTVTRSRAEWAPIFDCHELIWAPVQTNAEVLADEQARALNAFVGVNHPSIAGCRVVNSPIEFNSGPRPPYSAAPELGAHTEEVALEVGLSWDEIAALKATGALG
jgi:crotonobetainyl-CoA:carnitine CoA-transferase CaiB-like acyl-CoA transferase